MRSSTPIVVGFLALVVAAFYYDANAREIVDARLGGSPAVGMTSTATGSAGSTPPGAPDADQPVVVAATAAGREGK